MEDRKKDPLESVLYVSIFGMLAGLAVSVYFYTTTFNGGISGSSADWSVLGSFFGGIFSPIVSFVTLVAIIITIRLQKKFLETQIREFSKLHALQIKSLEAQDGQLSYTKEYSESEKITSYKQTLLAVIAQQIDLHQNIIERASKSAEYLTEKKLAQPALKLDQTISEALDQKEEYERKLNSLSNLSIAIALRTYSSTSELGEEFVKEFVDLQSPKCNK